MKLHLIPIRSRAYAVRDVDGKTYGIVRRRPRKQLPYHLRAQRLHTLFPSRLHIRGTGDKVFQTLADVRTFITDHPEKYWR